MKFTSIRDFRSQPKKIWKELKKDNEMVMTFNGKPFALLTPLSENNFEETILTIRKAKAIYSAQKMQEISISQGINTMTAEEINSEISDTRKHNKH